MYPTRVFVVLPVVSNHLNERSEVKPDHDDTGHSIQEMKRIVCNNTPSQERLVVNMDC